MSAMRDTMAAQPRELARLLSGRARIEETAERLRGRRVLLVGTGTSFHAAQHGAWLLREAGAEAWAVAAIEAALHGPTAGQGDAVVLLSHTGAKRYTVDVLAAAGEAGVPTVAIGGIGAPGVDVETVAQETSSAYTGSHLGALLRLAQLAEALGAQLGDLAAVPDAVAAVLDGPSPGVAPPQRVLEYTGAGPNAWTAAEGSLKVRETARIAAEGLGVEQLYHGPAVALDERDALVALDGGGPAASRLGAVAGAAEQVGVRVHRFAAPPSSASRSRSSRSPPSSSGSRSSAPRRSAPTPTPSGTTSRDARRPGSRSASSEGGAAAQRGGSVGGVPRPAPKFIASPMTSPSAPAIIRMTPTTWMSTPATVAVTANLRMAPTAMRRMLAPAVIAGTVSGRQARQDGPESRPAGGREDGDERSALRASG